MRFSSRSRVIRNTKTRFISLTTAAVVAVASLSGALPLFLSQNASAVSMYGQDFSADTGDWVSGGSYGSITAADGHAVVDGVSGGPFTRFDGYKRVWPGTFTASVDVYLDPSWAAGTGFDYSVAATGTDNNHQRDFVFHVAKDTSTNKLLVGASNNTSFTVREDLESRSHYEVLSAGVYTLKQTFRNNGGQLAVDFTVNSQAVTTLSAAQDTIPSQVGGNRYGWFTFVNVPGGLQIDNVTLNADSVATVTSGSTTTYYDSLQSALTGAVAGDTVTLLEDVALGSSYLNFSKSDITLDGNGHEISTTNSWVAGATGNGTTDYVIQMNADDVTIQDLTIRGLASSSPAGGINIFNRDGIKLLNITSVNNATAAAVVGSTVEVKGLNSSDSWWGHALNVDQGSAPAPGELTILGTNIWNEPRLVYVDNIAKGSVVDVADQYKVVYLTPNLSGANVTGAIYTAPTTPVTSTFPTTTSGGVASTNPLPADVVLDAGAASIVIPAGTTISGTGWNGALNAPSTVTAPAFTVPGYTVSNVVAVSVGADGVRLNFDQPVRVTLAGQNGKLAGFVDHTGAFKAITTECGADIDATLSGTVEECWTTDAMDLVIWTTHFTTFVAYSATAVPTAAPTTTTSSSSSSNSSTSSTRAAVVTTASVTDTAASVLGIGSGTDSAKTTNKAANAQNDNKEDSNAFLGLGWWWLAVLAALAAVLGYLFMVRRADRA